MCGLSSSINTTSLITCERKTNILTTTPSQQGQQTSGKMRGKTERPAKSDRVNTKGMKISSKSPNISEISPSLPISTQQPLTSTPIHPNPTHLPPDHTHNTTDLLERELREHVNNHQPMTHHGGNVRDNLSSGVGSTMENLMDFDVRYTQTFAWTIKYQITLFLPLSLPPSLPPLSLSHLL